jgi:hypothetical protein
MRSSQRLLILQHGKHGNGVGAAKHHEASALFAGNIARLRREITISIASATRS